jgi:hypothetical protein
MKWFVAGRAARRLNARIAMKAIDVRSLEPVAPSNETAAEPSGQVAVSG